MADEKKESKIVSDEGWKQQAQREKEKLTQQQGPAHTHQADEAAAESSATEAGGSGARRRGPLPAPTFMTLVDSLVLQALFCLGQLAEKSAGPAHVDIDLAKHHIDMLQILEDKTKGNLTEQEEQALAVALHECRMQYVQIAQSLTS